jgi:hypothetical protein
MTKCCHDIDLLYYYIKDEQSLNEKDEKNNFIQISSFGQLG